MARRGVTFEDIAATADALLDAGERPTAERIRMQLGRGSPNTIGPLLDRWWASLGARLRQQQAKLVLPEAPAEVTALASQLWEQAVLAARTQAEASLAQERAALASDRAALTHEVEQAQHAQQAQQAAVTAAEHTLAVAAARLAEVQQRADQQAEQLHDLAQQRDALHARNERQDHELAGLRERLQAQEATAAAEREALRQHARAIEERAHQEVDRARQEAKALRAQLEQQQRERQALEQEYRRREEGHRGALTDLQRELAVQTARADALEQQLARLSDLPSALQATLAKARPRNARAAPIVRKATSRPTAKK